MRSDAGPSRPLVVELLGLPGAGKTTLATQLIELLEERGVHADSITGAGRARAASTRVGTAIIRPESTRCARARRVFQWQLFVMMAAAHTVRFARQHPSLTRDVITAQARRNLALSRRMQIARSFLRLCGRYRCLTQPGGNTDVLVIDDGFVHRSVELHASGLEPPDLAGVERYIDAAPAPDLIVVAEASLATCEQRVRSRGVWAHSRELSPEQLSAYLVGARAVVDAATTRARARHWAVVCVDNDVAGLERLRRALDEAISDGALARLAPKLGAAVVA